MLRIPTLSLGIRGPQSYIFKMRPMPKDRGRAESNASGKTWVRNSDRTRDYEDLIRKATRLQHKGPSLKGDLVANVLFVFRSRRHGDLDNCLKSILDGMQPVAYPNDKQIRSFTVHSLYFDELPEEEQIERTEVVLEQHKSIKNILINMVSKVMPEDDEIDSEEIPF